MTKDAEQVRLAAMSLSEQDRVELAVQLLASVPVDESIEKAQAEESAARVRALEAGEISAISREEAHRIISG